MNPTFLPFPTRVFLFCFVAMLLILTPAQAQEHAIKLNLPSLLVGNISGSYEHSLSDKVALQLGIGILPGRQAPGSSLIQGIILENPDNTRFVTDIRFSGYSITPELRFYPFKEDMDLHGFYVAPALRFSRYALKTQYDYVTAGGEANSLQAKGTLTGFGGNLVIGYQIPIAEELTLDLYLGGGLNVSRLGISLKDEGLVAADYAEIEADILEEFGLNPENFPDIISDNGINLGFYLPVPVIRTGFALGYTF